MFWGKANHSGEITAALNITTELEGSEKRSAEGAKKKRSLRQHLLEKMARAGHPQGYGWKRWGVRGHRASPATLPTDCLTKGVTMQKRKLGKSNLEVAWDENQTALKKQVA